MYVSSATLVPVNLKDLEALDRLGAAIHERWGKLDILLGNAGQLGELAPLAHVDQPVWDEVMAVNVTANCVRFSYDSPQGRRFQAIRVDAGQLKMGWGGADIACAAATQSVSSEQLTLLAPAAGSVFESINANSIRLRLRGRYNANGLATDKTYSTVVAIRSGGV